MTSGPPVTFDGITIGYYGGTTANTARAPPVRREEENVLEVIGRELEKAGVLPVTNDVRDASR